MSYGTTRKLTINGKHFHHVDVDMTSVPFSSPFFATEYDWDVTIYTKSAMHYFLTPQIVDLTAIHTYQYDLLADAATILVRRVGYLMPECHTVIRDLEVYKEDPTQITKVQVILCYQEKFFQIGSVSTLLFLDDTHLTVLLEEALATMKKHIELEQQETDFLLLDWKLVMEHLGFSGQWRLMQVQRPDHQKGIKKGDIVLYVRHRHLPIFDPYIQIGPFSSLRSLSMQDLGKQIQAAHTHAEQRDRGE